MSTTCCYHLKCNREIEVSCNCTSPETHSCKTHLLEHCKTNNNPHNITSIFLEPIKATKEAILSLLAKKQTKIFEIKTKMLASFYQTLYSYKNAFDETLKEIDSTSRKMSNYYEKVYQAQKISSLEKDPALCLLTLQTSEAVEKVKSIFESSKNIELFYEMNSQIDKITDDFNKEKSKMMQNDIISNLISAEDLIDNKELCYKAAFEHYVTAIKENPNNDFAFSYIGNTFYIENKYKKAIKCYSYAIKINPRCVDYYRNKGDALKKLGKREKALECFNEAIRIDPQYADAYNSIGDLFYDEKNYEEAINIITLQLRSIQMKQLIIQIKELPLNFPAKQKKQLNSIK